MVLVCLSGVQPNTRRVGRAASATTWPVAYETAFQILHKLRAGMVRPDQDRIGGRPGEHVEVDETWAGGRTRGKGRGVHDKVLVASAVEVRQRKPGTKLDKRKGGRYAGRVRLAIVPDRSAELLCGFVECAVVPGTSLVTDDYAELTPELAERGGGKAMKDGNGAPAAAKNASIWPFCNCVARSA